MLDPKLLVMLSVGTLLLLNGIFATLRAAKEERQAVPAEDAAPYPLAKLPAAEVDHALRKS